MGAHDVSEYKGLLSRLFSVIGFDGDIDMIWRQQSAEARSNEGIAIAALNWGIQEVRSSLLRRLLTQKPPITPEEANQIRLTLVGMERTGAGEIQALNSQGGNAMVGSITANSVFVTNGSGPDPNNPIYIGVPPNMRRA